jgi:hypothetical protein
MTVQSVKYGDWLLTEQLGIRFRVGAVIFVSLRLHTASGSHQESSDSFPGCYFIDNKTGQAEVEPPLDSVE